MKLFLMTLLLSVYLAVASQQDPPELSQCQLEKILKHGWDDPNTTVKQAMIKLSSTGVQGSTASTGVR